jgi:hypothetical protein
VTRTRSMSCGVSVLLACGFVLVGVGGCAVATDLVNPDILTSLGIDPATVTPPKGTVILALHNDTTFDAQMFVRYSQDANGGEDNFIAIGGVVPSGTTTNRVFDCPVTFVQSGGALVLTEMPATVMPGGGALRSGSFRCGDVVEVLLRQVGADFEMRLILHPGR